jgi:AraC-like DNA-binding protein
MVPPRAVRGLTGRVDSLTNHAMSENAVAVPYARLLFEFLERESLDPEAVIGVQASALDQRERVPVPEWRAWLEHAQAAVNRPALGLEVGRLITPRHFGVLGYTVLHCQHLAAALARMERYHRLIYDVNPVHWRVEGADALVEWGIERGRPGQLVDETGLAAVVQFARDITAADWPAQWAWPLRDVWFVNPPPADPAPYEAFFNCPVYFGQPHTRLRFAGDWLARPLRQPDADLLAILDERAETLLAAEAERDPRPDPTRTWRRQLAGLLRDGAASLERLAELNHVSPRTLQRQLGRAGTRYQTLLDETRHMLARDYLADPRLELAEIAQLLGFSEQSAFTRAFRHWTGEPPERWRRRQRVG